MDDRPTEPAIDPGLPHQDRRDPTPEPMRSPGAARVPQDLPDPEPGMDAPGDGGTDGDGELPMDAGGLGGEAVGDDTIRDGTVRGVLGSPHGSHGQGQGG